MVKFILSGEETITIKLKDKRGARGFFRNRSWRGRAGEM